VRLLGRPTAERARYTDSSIDQVRSSISQVRASVGEMTATDADGAVAAHGLLTYRTV
jgi:hypothetical protein